MTEISIPLLLLLKQTGGGISKAVQESNYPPSVARPILITNSVSGIPGVLAYYETVRDRLVLNQGSVVNTLKEIREIEHGFLDSPSTPPNRLKTFLQRAGRLLNPITTPYALLGNRGQHIHSGNADRRWNYLDAAREGFEVQQDGQTVRLSSNESIARAKDFLDRLLERATPGIIGWIIAHEYEHRYHLKGKLALKAGTLLTPLIGGLIVSHFSSPESAYTIAAEGGIVGIIASAFGRKFDEKASYDAGDKNFAKFAKAVNIDHNFFQREVLGQEVPA